MVNKRYHISRSCQNIDGFAFGIDKLHFICCSVIFEYNSTLGASRKSVEILYQFDDI